MAKSTSPPIPLSKTLPTCTMMLIKKPHTHAEKMGQSDKPCQEKTRDKSSVIEDSPEGLQNAHPSQVNKIEPAPTGMAPATALTVADEVNNTVPQGTTPRASQPANIETTQSTEQPSTMATNTQGDGTIAEPNSTAPNQPTIASAEEVVDMILSEEK